MLAIDTNVLVRFLTTDDSKKVGLTQEAQRRRLVRHSRPSVAIDAGATGRPRPERVTAILVMCIFQNTNTHDWQVKPCEPISSLTTTS